MHDQALQVPFLHAAVRSGGRTARSVLSFSLVLGALAPGPIGAESEGREAVTTVAAEQPTGFVESGRDALRTFVDVWQLPSQRMLGSVVNGQKLRHPTTAEQPAPRE